MGWSLALAASGCFPVPDPPWLIDGPRLLAVRTEVSHEGPLSGFVASPPADRRRTELLPGDGATLVPWIADVTRTWNPDELDVAYFACFGVYCPEAVRQDAAMDACTDTVDLSAPVCFIGRGPNAQFVLPTGPIEVLSTGVPEILAVSGTPGISDTDGCIARLRAQPTEDVHDCLLLQRYVAVGPRWLMTLLGQAEQDDERETDGDTDGDASDTGDTDDEFVPPPEVFLEWPNFNPEVERFGVTVADRPIDASAGDVIAVKAGDFVSIGYFDDPRDLQRYVTGIGDDGSIQRIMEGGTTQWFATARLAPFVDEDLVNQRVVQWLVPRDVTEVRIDLRVDDGRGGVGWGSLLFEVDGTDR